jgi:hypothetical protein
MVITYLEAISQALREEMRRDRDVILLGEDIAQFGGAFKITRGFLDEFGGDRVVDRSSTTRPRPATAGARPFPLSSAGHRAEASAAVRSTRRIPRRGSRTCQA